MELNQKTILLVEDQVIISMMETQQLSQAGYTVITAETGEEAIKICDEQGESIHLILMDIDLGIGINGADAAKEILKSHEIPVVFLSSHIEKEVVETTEKITSYGYVVKNSGEVVLLASIKMAFKLYEAHQKIIIKSREIETVNQKLQETIEELQETSEEFEAANEELRQSQIELIEKEKILSLSEEKFSKAFRLSPDSININRLSDGVYIDINQGFTDIMGYTREETIGRSSLPGNLDIWIYPQDRQTLVDGLKAKGEVIGLTTQFRGKNGRIRTGMMSAKIIEINGETCILSITRDVTEQKKTEELINENAQFLQIILDSLPNPVFFKDAKLIYKGCNKAFEEFIKTSQENLISKTVYELFPKDLADIYQAMDIQLLNNPGIQSYESKIVNLQGERKEVLFHKATFKINGKVEGIVGTMIDLTEKKKAERALIESEERFRLLFERNNAVMFLIEPDSGKILDANLAAEQFYGYSHEKLRSMNIDDINMLSPIEVKKERMRALDNQRNYFVFPHKLANGEMRTVEVHSTPIITYGKLALFSIVHDITSRLEMEKALLESEKKYRNIFENIQDIFYQTDINGIITEISPSIKRYSGFERTELIGTPVESVYYNPEDRVELLKIINEKGEVSDYELRLKNKFNEEIIASINAHPLFDTAGKWIGTEGSLRDITCRKKVEYALRESEEQLRTLINSMPDIVCFKDGLGRWIEANDYDLELFNLKGVDYKGLKDSELAQYQTFYKKVFLECELSDEIAWKAGKMVRNEEVIPLPEGASKVFDIIKVPLFHKNGTRKGLVVIGRDITKLKEKEEMLNKAILQKETLMKELQHRVKNNLLVITSLLSLEMNKLTDSHSQTVFHNALSRINSMAVLYERLALSESLENVDFHIYVNNLANSIFESYLVEKGKIVLKTSLEKLELETRVAVPLGLVLNELITNVLKYAYPNEKKGELRITLKKEEGKGVLIVEDDGIGFPDELNTEKSNSLGLKLIRMMVKQIRGEVKIESEKGTKVSVNFTI